MKSEPGQTSFAVQSFEVMVQPDGQPLVKCPLLSCLYTHSRVAVVNAAEDSTPLARSFGPGCKVS